jgi:hypothetical protein
LEPLTPPPPSPAQAPFEGRDVHDKIARGAYAYPEDVEVSDDAKVL